MNNPERNQNTDDSIDVRHTPEYRQWVDIVSNEHPEIYQIPENDPEITKLTGEVLDQIPDQQLMEIVKTYQINSRDGDTILTWNLLGPLGLTKNPPEFKYEPGSADAKEKATYSRKQNRIKLKESKFTAAPHRLIDRFLRPKSEDPIFDRVEAVAHELWHAHQFRGDNVDPDRRDQYTFNYQCYFDIHGRDDDKEELKRRYKGQLVEAEALVFGEAMKNRARSLWYN